MIIQVIVYFLKIDESSLLVAFDNLVFLTVCKHVCCTMSSCLSVVGCWTEQLSLDPFWYILLDSITRVPDWATSHIAHNR